MGEKLGMGGTSYERAKYVAAEATPEVIEKIDNGEISVYATYQELRTKEKANKSDNSVELVAVEADEDTEDIGYQEDNDSENSAVSTPVTDRPDKVIKPEISAEATETIEADDNSDDDCQEDDGSQSSVAITAAVNTPTIDPPKSLLPGHCLKQTKTPKPVT